MHVITSCCTSSCYSAALGSVVSRATASSPASPGNLIRDKNSQVLPYTHWVRNLVWGSGISFCEPSRWFLKHSEFWEPLGYTVSSAWNALSHHPCQTPTHPLKGSRRKSLLDLWTYSLDHEYRTIHGHLCTHTALIRLPWVFYDHVLWWFVWKSFFFFKIFYVDHF